MTELEIWQLDQKINERGFPVDVELAEKVVAALLKEKEKLHKQLYELTEGKVETGRQVAAGLEFLRKEGLVLPNLQKTTVENALAVPKTECSSKAREFLILRQKLSMSSIDKYQRVIDMAIDGRIYGTLFYYGSHTGRWAGRGFQPQNIKRPTLSTEEIEQAIEVFKYGC